MNVPARFLAPAVGLAIFASSLGCSGLLGDFAIDDAPEPTPDAGPDARVDRADAGGSDAAGDAASRADGDADGSRAALTVTLGAPRLNVVRGGSARVDVRIARVGAAGEATVRVTGLPAGVTADPLVIAADGTSGTLVLHADAKATLGARAALTVTASDAALASSAPLALLVQDPSGTVDTTFGTAGKLTLAAMDGLGPEGIAALPDGRIVLGGSLNVSGTASVVLARIQENGAADTTFASSGVLTVNAPGRTIDVCFAVRPLANGGVVASGFSLVPAAGAPHSFLAMKTTAAGVVDTTFGEKGFALLQVGTGDSKAHSLVVQPDGKLVLAGFGTGASAMVRLLPDGRPDTSFGPDATGIVTNTFANTGTFTGVGLRSDGRVLVSAGFATSFLAFRYSPVGLLDATYGTAGHATTPGGTQGGNFGGQLLVQPDDEVVMGGTAGAAGTPTLAQIARFTDDGKPDATFGTGGVVTASFGAGSAGAGAVARGPDGSIAVAAVVPTTTTGATFGAARFTADGKLDAAFGGKGYVSTVVGTGTSAASAVAVDADGRILVGGSANDGTRNTVVVVRYWP